MEKCEFLGIINAKGTGTIFNRYLRLVVKADIENKELLIDIDYVSLVYDKLMEVEQFKITLNIPDLAVVTNFKAFEAEILEKVCDRLGFTGMELQ